VLFLSTITLLTMAVACFTHFGLPDLLRSLLPQAEAGDPSFGYHYEQGEQTKNRPTTIRRAATGGSARMELTQAEGPELSFKEIYDKNIPAIVFIQARQGGMASSGTGIVLSEDGYIITNEHVITGSSEAWVVFQDNTSLPAMLVGYYAEKDLAVLKVDAHGLTPAEFGNSERMQEGDTVVAIGNPLGSTLRGTMTEGIISAINRRVKVDGVVRTMIQTTAALNPGNSGGALIDSRGRVIGITTLKMMSTEETIEGLGFAIPTREAKTIVDQLVAWGDVDVFLFGFTVNFDPDVIAYYGGLYVLTVDERSDAYAKGLRPGDVITAADGTPVTDETILSDAKVEMEEGDELVLTILREGQQLEIGIALMDADELMPISD